MCPVNLMRCENRIKYLLPNRVILVRNGDFLFINIVPIRVACKNSYVSHPTRFRLKLGLLKKLPHLCGLKCIGVLFLSVHIMRGKKIYVENRMALSVIEPADLAAHYEEIHPHLNITFRAPLQLIYVQEPGAPANQFMEYLNYMAVPAVGAPGIDVLYSGGNHVIISPAARIYIRRQVIVPVATNNNLMNNFKPEPNHKRNRNLRHHRQSVKAKNFTRSRRSQGRGSAGRGSRSVHVSAAVNRVARKSHRTTRCNRK